MRKSRRQVVKEAPVICSFCGKDKSQVKKLIQGPSSYICNECIAICNEIIEEHRLEALVKKTLIELNNANWPEKKSDSEK